MVSWVWFAAAMRPRVRQLGVGARTRIAWICDGFGFGFGFSVFLFQVKGVEFPFFPSFPWDGSEIFLLTPSVEFAASFSNLLGVSKVDLEWQRNKYNVMKKKQKARSRYLSPLLVGFPVLLNLW